MNNQKQGQNAIQFLIFCSIGGMNALVDIGTLNLLLLIWPTEDTLWLMVFNTVAYCLAVTNSYVWNSRLTFGKKACFSRSEKILFVLQALASLLISNGVFILTYELLHEIRILTIPAWVKYNIAKGAAMTLSSTASFFFMKYVVFVPVRKLKIIPGRKK